MSEHKTDTVMFSGPLPAELLCAILYAFAEYANKNDLVAEVVDPSDGMAFAVRLREIGEDAK